MFNKLLFTLLLTLSTLQAMDQRLYQYPDAKKDYVQATKEKDQSAAFDLALFYDKQLHDNKKAIAWYKKAYKLGSERATLNLGNLYFSDKKYKDAQSWFMKAHTFGDVKGTYNIAYLYDEIYNKDDLALSWYKEAAKSGYSKAINNLNKTYYEKGDKITSSAYALAMINYGYTQKEVFDFLKKERKIGSKTLKKAYDLQLTLDIPKHYTGGID